MKKKNLREFLRAQKISMKYFAHILGDVSRQTAYTRTKDLSSFRKDEISAVESEFSIKLSDFK